MTPELEEYILTHIDKEDELLASLDRNTHLYHLRPRMVSGHLQGRILKMFCRMIRPHRILELGTFTGYSALCLAEGLTEGGEVHTIEIDDEIEDFTRSYFDKSPLRDRIKLIIGDASSAFDCFLDGISAHDYAGQITLLLVIFNDFGRRKCIEFNIKYFIFKEV